MINEVWTNGLVAWSESCACLYPQLCSPEHMRVLLGDTNDDMLIAVAAVSVGY